MLSEVCTPGFRGLATSFPRFAHLALEVWQHPFRGLHAWLSRCDNVLAEVCKPVLLRWRASSSPLTEGIICWFSCLHVCFFHRIGRTARVVAIPRVAPRSQHAPASRARGQEADGRSHSLLSGFLKLAAPVDPGSDRSRKRPRTAHMAAIPRFSCGRARAARRRFEHDGLPPRSWCRS